jgi:hypothetical protein
MFLILAVVQASRLRSTLSTTIVASLAWMVLPHWSISRAKNFPQHAWLTADMRSLPPLGAFHGLIAWHSFFHLKPEDQRLMFETFSRLSLSGAALMFTSGTKHGEAIGTFEGQPLYHGSLDSAEYRHLLQVNDFDLVEHIENDPTCGGATIWLALKMIDAG